MPRFDIYEKFPCIKILKKHTYLHKLDLQSLEKLTVTEINLLWQLAPASLTII